MTVAMRLEQRTKALAGKEWLLIASAFNDHLDDNEQPAAPAVACAAPNHALASARSQMVDHGRMGRRDISEMATSRADCRHAIDPVDAEVALRQGLRARPPTPSRGTLPPSDEEWLQIRGRTAHPVRAPCLQILHASHPCRLSQHEVLEKPKLAHGDAFRRRQIPGA